LPNHIASRLNRAIAGTGISHLHEC
jgi:hypothetical protein